MPDYRHALIIILVMGLMTFATRIVPVLIFGRGEKVPEYVIKAVSDDSVIKYAFNASFERVWTRCEPR